jgi:hypothetical protein
MVAVLPAPKLHFRFPIQLYNAPPAFWCSLKLYSICHSVEGWLFTHLQTPASSTQTSFEALRCSLRAGAAPASMPPVSVLTGALVRVLMDGAYSLRLILGTQLDGELLLLRLNVRALSFRQAADLRALCTCHPACVAAVPLTQVAA